MEFKKNIILLPANYNGLNNQKGILNIECGDKNIKCNVKCFNVKPTDEKFLFSIVVNEQMFKTNILAKELTNLTFVAPINVKSGDKISCLILAVKQRDYEVILWGSTETTKAWQTTVTSIIETELEKTTVATMQDTEYENEQAEIEDYIDKTMEETEPKQTAPDYQNDMFYERVKNQIQDMFDSNEKDDLLQDIIPNGKFCKVKMKEGYYVFGVIFDDNEPKYICYAIPCLNKGEQPEKLKGICEWLPLDNQNQNGKGYWISYQDAYSGENIKMEVIS